MDAPLAGEPDGFQRLWTPHRMVYIKDAEQRGDDDTCPFCAVPAGSDEDGLIVARGEHVFALLNLFPYNPGHLLLCPYRHIASYAETTEAERTELNEFTLLAMAALRATSAPVGFNFGMNQGELAGAGIAAHLHQHLVPRWKGDANFMPIIARTKALPELLGDTRDQLAAAWGR